MNSFRPAVLFAAVALLPATAHGQAIQAWVQESDIPNHFSGLYVCAGLAVDAAGNVVVSGPSYAGDGSGNGNANDDWLTMKYSSAGMPLWTNRYNGPGNFLDKPMAIAVDASGNVVVAGGTCLSTDFSDTDYATIKYSSGGQPLWTNRYDGPAHNGDIASAIAVDASGNIYVTGVSAGADYPDSSDYATTKYSSAGVPLWTNRYNGPAHGPDNARAIAVDVSGNVFVTGCSPASGIANDFLTIKYSSAGVPLWTRRFKRPGDQQAEANALAVDAGGNVIVAGFGSGNIPPNPPQNGTGITIKYSNAGVPLWTNYYDGPAAKSTQAAAVIVDANDDIYVTAASGGITTYSEYATLKYSSAGVPLWTNRYDGLGGPSFRNQPRALALDASGNVLVTGGSTGPSGVPIYPISDFATIAYSSSGVPLWTNRYNGPANKSDDAFRLAADASNNVYVVGTSETSDSSMDGLRVVFATIKYVVPPIIYGQPRSRTNAVGTTASFSVEVAGGLPLSYQWRRDNTNLVEGGRLSGVTTTNLVIADVQLSDEADYTVTVTNEWGSAMSTIAHLTVTIPPSAGRFANFTYSPAMGFSFIFRDATVGQPYRIQTSPTAAAGSWVDWESFTYTGPKGLMDVEAVASSNKFYRAVSP